MKAEHIPTKKHRIRRKANKKRLIKRKENEKPMISNKTEYFFNVF